MKKKKFYRNLTLFLSMAALFGVSYKFNQFVDQLENEDKLYNNLDIVVMIGVGFTTLPLFFLFGFKVWVTTILLFCASSPPVVIGYRRRIEPHYFWADQLHRQLMDELK